MKKTLAIFLVLVTLLSATLVACKKKTPAAVASGGEGENETVTFESVTEYEPVMDEVAMESQTDSFTLFEMSYGAEDSFQIRGTVAGATVTSIEKNAFRYCQALLCKFFRILKVLYKELYFFLCILRA